jgi:hypothetical protein
MARKAVVKPKRPSKPKLTDAERHKRFVEMADEVEADKRPEAFEGAFDRVTSGNSPKK